MGQNLIVTLRVYRGAINYDAKGKIKSENQTLNLTYGVLEWINFMDSARIFYSRMEIEKVREEIITWTDTEYRDKGGNIIKKKNIEYKVVDAHEEMKKDVKTALDAPVKYLTPDQKRIADLEARIDAISTQGRGKTHKVKDIKPVVAAPPVDKTPNTNEELETARKRVHELTGKKPHHMTQLKKLNQIIKENS